MSKTYIKNPYFLLDGEDYSAQVKSVEVDRKKDELDTTASGDDGHTAIHGLSGDSFTLNLYQPADMSTLDAKLSDIYENELTVVCEVCEAGSVVSESNPSFSGNVKLFEHKPISGDVGTVLMTPVVLKAQGSITRSGT
jgi:hypothetical protein